MPDRLRDIPHDAGFTEIADRCWVARFEFLDVNVGLVGGERGLLMVDTHASEADARRVVEQVRRLGVGDVVAVVNTHEHFDHTFGNVVLSEEYGAPAGLRARGGGRGARDQRAGPAAGGVGRRQRAPAHRHRGHPDPAAHRDVLVDPRRGPRRPAGGAGPPRPRAHRRRRDRPGRRRRRGLRRRPGRGVGRARWGARVRRRLLPDGVARDAGPGDRPAHARTASWSRATGCRSTRTSSTSSAPRSGSSRRRSATWPPGACPRGTPWRRPSGPTRRRSW